LISRPALEVIREISTSDGVGQISSIHPPTERECAFSQYFADRAREILQDDLSVRRAVISGMASSNMGWKALPYASVPMPLDASALIIESVPLPLSEHRQLQVVLVSGVRAACDVMRGEEVQLLGLSLMLPGIRERESVLVILPGTHSKHVSIEQGIVTSFSTYMTGELFASLPRMASFQSLFETAQIEDRDRFLEGVHVGSREDFSSALFKTRASATLEPLLAATSSEFLSGVLIGAELASLKGSTAGIYLYCSGKLTSRYCNAAKALGVDFNVIEPEAVAESLLIAHRAILENPQVMHRPSGS